ncbi:undecaprenyldiphospho-muramoylpentapeptide beta-N-acetylglucosaminyltransferase [Thermosulfuriphilus sp.]
MRLVVAGGGTGGHLFPGVAVAKAAQKKGIEVLFISSGRALERGILKEAGLPTAKIYPRPFLGQGLSGKVAAIWALTRETLRARGVLRSFKAEVVLGLGGYTALPVVMAARTLGLPVAVHEQNAVAGLANRLAACLAQRIFVSFQASVNEFGASKAVFTGNPVRQELLSPCPRETAFPSLLVLGGSQGARRLNQVVPEALKILFSKGLVFSVIHQTGLRDEEEVRQNYSRLGIERVMIFNFIADMAWAYSQVDLVVSRAGATTVAELSCLGKPAVLIPYPYAGGHQRENARALIEAGGALMLEEDNLTPSDLAQVLEGLLTDKHRLDSMAQKARELRLWGDPEDIVRELFNLLADFGEARCTRNSISTL